MRKNIFQQLLQEDTTDALGVFAPDMPMEPTSIEEENETGEMGETEETLQEASKYFNEATKEIDELKVKYPETTHPEIAKALDDITAAIEVARHHIEDIGEDLPTNEGESED